MKRWMSLLTIAIFVVAFATPVVAGPNGSGGGGCSPSISGASKMVSGTSGNITVAAAGGLGATAGTGQPGAHGRAAGAGGAGQGRTGGRGRRRAAGRRPAVVRLPPGTAQPVAVPGPVALQVLQAVRPGPRRVVPARVPPSAQVAQVAEPPVARARAGLVQRARAGRAGPARADSL